MFSVVLASLLGFAPLPKGRLPVLKETPSDVKSGHWAKHSTLRLIEMGVLGLRGGGKFGGDQPPTRTEVAKALVAWAKRLEAGTWKSEKSAAVSASALSTLDDKNWAGRPLTRYVLADTLARAGDYFARSLPSAPRGDKTVASSRSLPSPPKITLTQGHPAYVSLNYLAAHRMLDAHSPLLHPEGGSLNAAEFSSVLARAAAGLVDRVTPLGLDENGSTPDKSFHPKRP